MATARIGETKEQCDKRYGNPMRSAVDQSIVYRTKGFTVTCFFGAKGVCSLIEYKPVESIELAKKIWKGNHPTWIAMGSGSSHLMRAKSVQTDGYNDMLLWYNKASMSLKIYSKDYHELHPNLDDPTIREKILADSLWGESVNHHYGKYLKENFAHSSYDDLEGIRWYEPGVEGRDYGIMRNRASMPYATLYISQRDGGKPNLRLKLQYSGNDWIFMNKFKIKIGDDDLVSIVPSSSPKRKAQGYGVRESFDESISPNWDILNKIIRANDVVIRMSGSEGYSDLKFTPKMFDQFKKIIVLYRHLGGHWPTDVNTDE